MRPVVPFSTIRMKEDSKFETKNFVEERIAFSWIAVRFIFFRRNTAREDLSEAEEFGNCAIISKEYWTNSSTVAAV